VRKRQRQLLDRCAKNKCRAMYRRSRVTRGFNERPKAVSTVGVSCSLAVGVMQQHSLLSWRHSTTCYFKKVGFSSRIRHFLLRFNSRHCHLGKIICINHGRFPTHDLLLHALRTVWLCWQRYHHGITQPATLDELLT